MPDLVSPGVSVTLTEDNPYAGADKGPVPCIFIATHSNKISPGGSSIAPGTLDSESNKMQLVTSQRQAIQLYGDPVFYKSNGTPLHGYELNEYGLHALYQYLGVSNRAWVVRADIDLGQLVPSSLPPRGNPTHGTYWLDLNNTKWGIFESNGNRNPGLAWEYREPTVIENESKAITFVKGSSAVVITNHATQPIITSSGAIIVNNVSITLSAGDTLLGVMTKINNASIPGIKASLTAKATVIDNNGNTSLPNKVKGISYNLKLTNSNTSSIAISGDIAVITQLGLNNYQVDYAPDSSIGKDGDYAVLTFLNDNRVYQKLTPEDATGIAINTPDVGSQWLLVGSPEWKAATPTIVTSRMVTSAFGAGWFEISTTTGNHRIVVDSGDTVNELYFKINNTPAITAEGIIAQSTGTQLVITNVKGAGITFTAQNGNVLDQLDIQVTTYDGNKLTYATHAVVPNPSQAGDVWIKTTKPNRGASWTVKRYNAQLGQWTAQTAPLYATDADAVSSLGTSLAAGIIYIQYDTSNDGTATHLLRRWNGTRWEDLVYEASTTEPTSDPVNGTLWFNNNLQVDLMVSNGSQWYGYRNHYPNTDIILSASEPYTKPTGGAIIENDIWIDTSDLENYPKIYRNLGGAWNIVDNTDQTTPFGIVFSDARQDDGRGNVDYDSMLTSNYVDLDAPDALTYPDGVLLFNTRYSSNNVKKWVVNHSFEGRTIGNRWVTVSGNDIDGSPFMGRKAQRILIVRALSETIVGNDELRNEAVYFNLIAAPGYTEVIDEMVTLNVDKKQWAFIVADTPARLKPNATDVQNWAQNAHMAGSNGERGLTSANPYVGLYYPWGLSTNIDGTECMIPPSTMALRTLAYNDNVAYMWMAPAGMTRGVVSNATTTGYLTSEGEFKPVLLNQGQRDTLYVNKINPIAFIPNHGLIVYGQKTLNSISNAMDRVNVARLTNYLRYQLEWLAKPYLFEQNDAHTRDSVKVTFDRFLADLMGLRAMYDFVVVCDETNNTPERVNRSELWIDIAIAPERAVEFIYIPIRLVNPGESLS